MRCEFLIPEEDITHSVFHSLHGVSYIAASLCALL